MHRADCPRQCREIHPPLPPKDFDTLPESGREIGWVDENVLAKHAFKPANDAKVFVCGLPSVYESLCGSKEEKKISGVLAKLGYSENMVVKF